MGPYRNLMGQWDWFLKMVYIIIYLRLEDYNLSNYPGIKAVGMQILYICILYK